MPPALSPEQLARELSIRDLSDPAEGAHAIQRLRPSWQHCGTPHQLNLWRVSRRPLGSDDLEEMIETLAGALTPGRPVHSEARTHP
ncbi:MAG TPA: hypothetical protein VMD59_19145 [Acidimicrobiales bacterium]|nr:hypothetical protein [Acidimicrobiales bacterium]